MSRKAAMRAESQLDIGGPLEKELERTLRKSALFEEIPPEALAALQREFQVRTYAQKDVIFFEGQRNEEVLLMLRGVATLTYLDSRARRVLFAVIGPGEVWCGGNAMPDLVSERLRLDAVRDCIIAGLDYARLVELLFGIPYARYAAVNSFLSGTRNVIFTREVTSRGKALRARLLEVLEDLCERFGIPDGASALIDLPLTHEDLADLVGASRPKVTYEVRLLEKEGLLARQGRRFVVRRPKTHSLSSL